MPISRSDNSASAPSKACAAPNSGHGVENVFPSEEMTDVQFDQFVLIENNEIPLSSVNFRKKLRTIVSVL